MTDMLYHWGRDLTTYLSAKHLAATSSSGQTANITSSQTFFWVKMGISGGTIGSLYAIAGMSDDEKKAITNGEFSMAKSKSPFVISSSRLR